MFTGAVPRQTIEQLFKVVDLSSARRVFVCCSGSFRLEQALTIRGIFKLHSRKPGQLQYTTKVRNDDSQTLYRQWWKRHAS